MTIQFTDDEIETIKEIICEHGNDCPATDYEKVKELEYKLGLSVRPTPEEIAERERRYAELGNSEYGKRMAELMAHANRSLAQSIFADIMRPSPFDETNFKIGSTLRIRLPNDFKVKE